MPPSPAPTAGRKDLEVAIVGAWATAARAANIRNRRSTGAGSAFGLIAPASRFSSKLAIEKYRQ
jgi:hypothetical protein